MPSGLLGQHIQYMTPVPLAIYDVRDQIVTHERTLHSGIAQTCNIESSQIP